MTAPEGRCIPVINALEHPGSPPRRADGRPFTERGNVLPGRSLLELLVSEVSPGVQIVSSELKVGTKIHQAVNFLLCLHIWLSDVQRSFYCLYL